MQTLPIQLTYSQRAESSPATGWFVPLRHSDQIATVAATCLSTLRDRPTRLFLVATKNSGGHHAGHAQDTGLVVLLVDGSIEPQAMQGPLGTAVALRNCASNSRLWIPANASLSPLLELTAFEKLLPGQDAVQFLVWMPSTGLLGFESGDELLAKDLFTPPPSTSSTEATWSSPPETFAPPATITDFTLLNPPSADAYLELADDIGDPNRSLRDLDDDSSKTGNAVRKFATMLRGKLRGKLQQWAENAAQRQGYTRDADGKDDGLGEGRASNRVGNTSPRLSAADRIKGVATRIFSKALQKERESQIDKLLRIMAKNPDKALKFAIPLASFNSGRGFALPGARLLAQAGNFSLKGLFSGSGPVDAWEIGDQQQAQLRNAYRQQAEREMSLGRYDRAAYIFAKLLGDLSAAAGALENGKRFSEAAAIYERLHRTADQARCLESAGRLSEAAERYEHCEQFEKAAQLWLESGRSDQARAAFETAIEKAQQRGDYVQAARLIKKHLADKARAEELLWSCWPGYSSAIHAAQEAFAWLAEDGRHAEAAERLDTMQENALGTSGSLAKLAAHLFRTYPQNELRWQAEDVCRVACSSYSGNSDYRVLQGIHELQALAHDDSILRDDINLFVARSKQHDIPLQPESLEHRSRSIALASQLWLTDPTGKQNSKTQWFSADIAGGHVFAAGSLGGELLLAVIENVHGSEPQINCFPPIAKVPPPGQLDDPPRMMLDRRSQEYLIGFDSRVTLDVVGPFRFGQGESCRLNPELRGTSLDRTVADDGSVWTFEPFGFDCERSGETRRFDIAWPLLEVPGFSNLVAVANLPYIGLGKELFSVVDDAGDGIHTARGDILRLGKSLRGTAARVVLATDSSLELVYLDRQKAEVIDYDRSYSHACLLHGGRLAAVSGRELLLYKRTQNHLYHQVGSVSLATSSQYPKQSKVVSILSISVKKLAVVFEDGLVQIYRLT